MKLVRSLSIACLLGCVASTAFAQKAPAAPAPAAPEMSGEMLRATQLDYGARVKDLLKAGVKGSDGAG